MKMPKLSFGSTAVALPASQPPRCPCPPLAWTSTKLATSCPLCCTFTPLSRCARVKARYRPAGHPAPSRVPRSSAAAATCWMQGKPAAAGLLSRQHGPQDKQSRTL